MNPREACVHGARDRPERRRGERRRHVVRALLYGSLNPRRRTPRRAGELTLSAVDWHAPHWLAIAILIVTFSCSDAFLTLLLLERGAHEVNPLMARLLAQPVAAFALVKIGLTAVGVVLLTQLARVRAFGRVPVGLVLYTLLAVYGLLMVYEFGLLNRL
jgi:Domain of unknown function (DUF5658)